ncbi:MAG: PKD domain-containing protein [Bacteroidota bacterium]
MIQKAHYACVTLLLLLISFNAFAQPGYIGFAADFEFGDDTADLFGKTLFTNTSTWTDSTTQYRWSFGDGDTVYTKVPSHSYFKQGSYTICLLAYNLKQNGDTTCRDNACKQITVRFDSCVTPVADIIRAIDPDNCYEVSFTTNTQGYQYYWYFGDGDTDSGAQVTKHTYDTVGTYNACLVIFNIYGNNQICADTACDSIKVCLSTGVINPHSTQVLIYPNPVNDVLVVDIPDMDEATVIITDVIGRVQLRKTIHCTEAMQVNSLSQGIYYVTVEREGVILHRQRIVK